MIYKRGDVYWMDVTIKGNRIRKSLRTSDKQQAQELHDKTQAKAWDEQVLGKTKSTWQDIVDLWLLHKTHKKSISRDIDKIKLFSSLFANCELQDIKPQSLLKALPEAKPATINRYLALLKSMLTYAHKHNLIEAVPSISLFPEKPREVYLTREQYTQLVNNLPDKELQATVAFAVETGLRLGNITRLKKEHISEGVLYISSGEMKSNRPFSLPLSTKALALLKDNDYSFEWSSSMYKKFKQAAESIGMPDLRFHDLRHSYATWLAQDGVPIEVISKLLHHSSIATTERYRHMAVEDLRRYVK